MADLKISEMTPAAELTGVFLAVPSILGTTNLASVNGAIAGIYSLSTTGVTVFLDEVFSVAQDCKAGYIAIGY